MSPIIHIPKPCHENWNAMQPAEQGRHCNARCKTVIDFTTWGTGDIAGYLADPANIKTCGRFHKTQLKVAVPMEIVVPATSHEWTERIYQSSLSAVRKIAAVIIVVFAVMGTGCKKPMSEEAVKPITQEEIYITVGEIQPVELMGDTVIIQDNDSLPVCRKDSIAEQDMIKGRTAMRVAEDGAE